MGAGAERAERTPSSFRISLEHKKRITKTIMDKNKKNNLRLSVELFLQSQTDSPIKEMAATNQNRVLPVIMAIKVISVMPT